MKSTTKRASLKATVGAAAAAMLMTHVPQFEGMILRGYKDPIGIVTACAGHTKTAVFGRPYTIEECIELLIIDLVEHSEGVLKCTPKLKDKPYQLAAASSFAYNIGVGAYCRSTTARRFNASNYAGACKAMNESDSGRPQWVYAGGKQLSGLVKRRAIEREICETSLPESPKGPPIG